MIYKTMNCSSTSWATLLAWNRAGLHQTLDSELFVSQRTSNSFPARNAKPNRTEVAQMGLNVSNNSPSISSMQVVTKQSFSGSEQQEQALCCPLLSVPPTEPPCRTKGTAAQQGGAGGGSICFPACWDLQASSGCSFTLNQPQSSSLLFLHRHSCSAWRHSGFPQLELLRRA